MAPTTSRLSRLFFFTVAGPFLIGALVAAQAAPPSPRPTPAQGQKDLAFLASAIRTRHAKPFAHQPASEFDARVSALSRDLPTSADDGVRALRLATLAASIGDGHTSLQVYSTLPELPRRWYWFEGRLLVTGAAAVPRRWLGQEVVRIGRLGTTDAAARVAVLIPQHESPTFVLNWSQYLLRMPAVLQAVETSSSDSDLEVTFRDDRGVESRQLLPAMPSGALSATTMERPYTVPPLAKSRPGEAPPTAQTYDLVIANGRVVDPESGLDATRHIGIRGDRLVRISSQPLEGRDTIEARGLVVAPGFIDIHRHAHGDNSYRFQARDGVTSAFELEIGTADVEGWYQRAGPVRLVNYGVAVGHIPARMQVLGDAGFMLPTGAGRGPASDAQAAEIAAVIDTGLRAGAVAVGMGLAYTPGASAQEVRSVFQAAAKQGASVHAHLAGGLSSLRELIDVAMATGAPLHVAHINSTAGRDIAAFLEAVRVARARRVDVTTEVYPYTAGATLIQSALYDAWDSWPDDAFARLQWAATGERLTRETFKKYRAAGGSVISHSSTEEILRISLADPLPMFASDGGRDAADNPTHPRAAGTFARILGQYVRNERLISLPDAIRRMTLEPARRLEARVPDMRDRGRIRIGTYADLTIFDAERVIDRATYTNAGVYSEGIVHVLVNGVPVVRQGELVAGRTPGRAIRSQSTVAASFQERTRPWQ